MKLSDSPRPRPVLTACCLAALLLLAWASSVRGQQAWTPQRGFEPGGSYAISDIETVNTSNGGVMLSFPFKLPPGRGGSAAQISLHYNSKIFDGYPDYFQPTPGNYVLGEALSGSDLGGWHYGVGYTLQLIDKLSSRSADQPVTCDDVYRWQVKIVLPDGSVHELLPRGWNSYQAGDGYYSIQPGQRAQCSCTAVDGSSNCISYEVAPGSYPTGTITYYSFDGTFLRLDWQPSGAWTLYVPDGTRVAGTYGSSSQRVYDRNGSDANGNYITIDAITYNGHPSTRLLDPLGRSVILEFGSAPNQDTVHMTGAGGNPLTYQIKWATTNVNKTYLFDTFSGNSPGDSRTAGGQLVVTEIDLPPESGGLKYTFGYNAPFSPDAPTSSSGWGELNSVVLPSGAQAQYHYALDGQDRVLTRDALRNTITQKALTYLREYDGGSTPVTETTGYNIGDNQNGAATITGPDGGTTTEYGDSFARTYKVVHPDGTVVERVWDKNIPQGHPFTAQFYNQYSANTYAPELVNRYVKREFTSVKDAGGNLSKTAIKEYAYDKNGNVAGVSEYDWVAYGSVPRDSNGNPTGIPAGAAPKRVTATTYSHPTPDASDTSSNWADSYWNATSPSLRTAPASAEVGDGTNTLSRAEFFYDDAGSTGNLTQQKNWDSTQGGLTRPLTSANSVSVSHQYDTYGNVTLTTDALGHQTQFVYGTVGSVADLYPTQVRTAYQTSVQRTETREYDFSTGLVTRTTDADNNVSDSSVYDVFGRPTLTVAAEGKPEETRTVTVYSDVSRRVVVRRDLNTAGDGKLVSVMHYDQLGRVRLMRTLEDSSTQSETDETAGIKVQTRYAYGNPSSDPYSYTLVSNPYRAANSAAAVSETTMGWSRTRVDQGGRVVEVQTFKAGTSTDPLPAPWGTNSAGTGAVTTAYSAELTTVTDQMGRQRRSSVDGLRRLVRMDEPDKSAGNLDDAGGNPVQPTAYSYDALGNLTVVRQGGALQNGTYVGGQTRTFSYSSLSRLSSATNPESGTVGYLYDLAGNLQVKTDARGVSTHYEYDALNRVTRRWYNGSNSLTQITNNQPALPSWVAPTDEVKFYYDSQVPPTGWPASFDRGFAAGRLVATTYGGTSSGTYAGYDALGRPLRSVEQLGGVNYTVGPVTYNLAGGMKSETYPSGNVVTTSYDAAGRVSGVTGSLGDNTSRTYASGISYSPSGGMSQELFGTATPLYHKLLYNSREQLAEIRVGFYPLSDPQHGTSWERGAIINDYSDTAWGVSGGGADNNGNLHKQEVYVPNVDGTGYDQNWSGYSQSFTYDYLNRLSVATESSAASWTQSYGYDAYGNRTISQSGTTNAPATQFDAGEAAATNRLYAPGDTSLPMGQRRMQYDAAGNLAYDGYTGAGARAYDAENRMTTAQINSSQSAVYTYDGESHRVKRNTGGGEVWQVYGIGGELLAEYAAGASPNAPQEEYGYRGGELLITATVTGGWGAPPSFTGPDPLSTGDRIKLVHLTDLRSAVNQLRQHVGLPPYNFTVDPGPQQYVTTVKADHIRQLRAALEEARTRLGLSTGGYFQPTLYVNTSPIYAKDFQELRDQIRGAWAAGSGAADVRWLVQDQLGTPRMVIDHTGTLSGVVRHDYFPFGEEISVDTNWRNMAHGYGAVDGVRQKFTGKERDVEVGLDYFGARYYSGSAGRWLSPDWSEEPEPIPYADLTNPQTLNLYTYVGNNPLSEKDSDGHGCDWCQKLWNGLNGRGFKTDKEIEDEKNAEITKKNQEAYKDAEELKKAGVDPAQLAKLSNQQIIDLYNAIQRGDTSVESEGLKITIQLAAPVAPVIPKVSNPKLQNLVDDLYKGAKSNNPIGTGSTADAVREEMKTGNPVGGRWHTQKAQEYIRALDKWLRNNPNASLYDRLVAQSIRDDLASALAGK